MNIQLDDVITMKKKHPCGSDKFKVLRIGADFRLQCLGCGREFLIPRVKVEKNIIKAESLSQSAPD